MKNVCAAIAATLLAAALAACSESSTVPEPGAPAAGPSRNGGLGYGSGNVVPTDTSTNTTAAGPTGTTATEPTDSAGQERGGMGYGSGN